MLVADGVGGLDLCGTALALRDGGAEARRTSCKVVPWGHGLGRWHADLTNAANRDARPARSPTRSGAFRGRNARARRSSWSASRGGRAWSSRRWSTCPTDAVEVAVLISPALSPAYDLTRGAAGRPARDGRLLVAAGRDRARGGDADLRHDRPGQVGQRGAGRVPPARAGRRTGRRRQYAKLRQVRWRPAMATTGYLGGHVGPDSPAFLRKYVVPLLRVADARRVLISPVGGQAGRAPRR